MSTRIETSLVSAIEDQLTAVIESTPDPFIIVEPDGTIQRVNRQAELFFGYNRDELIGLSYKILVPDRFRRQHDVFTRKYREQPEMREMGSGLELVCLHRSGVEIPVEIGLSPIVAKNGSTIMVRFRDIRGDIEKQRVLRDALQESDEASRTKTRFLAAASHDLRQPLQSISMYLGVLTELTSDRDITAVIEKCQDSVEATNRLLDALLNITKLESGKVQPEFSDFDIRTLLEQMRNIEALSAREKRQQLVIVNSSATVRSDPALLGQLITNYVANAIRYTPPGGHIVVGCRRLTGHLRIEVCDNGPGIPSRELDSIFDEYRQLEDEGQLRGKGLGLGLGLSIVKLIAELLGLTLEVRSTPGKGSCFSVLVPLAARQLGRRPLPVKTDPIKRKSTGCILLIDDDAAVLDSTRLFLQLSGFTVLAAKNSQEAMAAIAGTAPELIITDYSLAQKENGIELLGRLRAVLKRDVPAIIITGDTSELSSQTALPLDCDLLRKPVDVHTLMFLLENKLGS
ncbi:MAG: ATP-binding protein [Gammaproteobacteria bacterium]|nr:ATP-binding protein [Gammaproteobacteria bacterium]MDP2140571.1 ATP-binding protein [Gammaproteobacteria bacterium]MDP2347340.1 ATP-binding protein [Gammaproteobacteria bacterium]